MRRLVAICSGLAALTTATSAMATDNPPSGGTFNVKVAAIVGPECRFATNATSVILTNDSKQYDGSVDFYCNFDTPISTFFQTTNGALVNVEDSNQSVPYQFYVGTTFQGWLNAADFTSGLAGVYGNHAPAGQTETHVYGFKLSDNIVKAGIYSDTFTLTFTP